MGLELTVIEDIEKASMVHTGKIDPALVQEHKEVVLGFAPLYEYAKSFEGKAKQLKKLFDEADDEGKLELAKDAQKIEAAVKKSRTKGSGGAEAVKAEYKEISNSYIKAIDSCFNVVAGFSKEIESDMQEIKRYADVLQAKADEALREERALQVEDMGATEFVGFDEDFAAFTPEGWDMRLGQFHDLVEAKKIKQAEADRIAEEERKAQEAKAQKEADAKVLRDLRGSALAELNFFYNSDLAELSDVEFMQLQAKAKAEKAEADKQAEALRLKQEEEAKAKAEQLAEERKAQQAKAEQERKELEKKRKAQQEEQERINEQNRLLEAEKQKQAQAEAERQKSLQGNDTEKLKLIIDDIRKVQESIASIEMSSDKGNDALEWIASKLETASVGGYDMYNKLR